MVITFENVSFKYIEKYLLNDVSFSITDQDKIGVIGVNGAGKTTLLKLILELEAPAKGRIVKSGGLTINYLPQNPSFQKDCTLLEIVMENQSVLHPIAEYEAKSILSKLGLRNYDETISHLSGGEQRRLALAKALVSYCDILILDEPTNHLDNDMIVWLEGYLMKMKKGLIMVTHDRYFLQRVCNKMLELDAGKTYLYDANYEAFLALKAERLAQEKKSQKKLKSILKKESDWINRGVEARRTKSKSRIERFEKLSKIVFHDDKEMNFSSVQSHLGKQLIEIKEGFKAFTNKILFQNFSFNLQRNDIVGIVGENGCGKTTLFKIILGEEQLDQGSISLGSTLKIGYFSQHLDTINPDIRVIDYLEDAGRQIETLEGTISSSELLENFLFEKEQHYVKVKMLSGGEQRRLQLVKVLATNPNLLILDEPTNDLDVYTIEILENYLENFFGPVLIVSHDRYFLDKLCNKLLVFENAHIQEHMISFSEYLKLERKEASGTPKLERQKKNKLPAAIRNEYNALTLEIKQMEEHLTNLGQELKQQTTDYHKMMALQEEIDFTNQEMDSKITRLFELDEIKAEYE